MTQLPHTASPGMWWPARCPLPSSHVEPVAPPRGTDVPKAAAAPPREVLMGYFRSAAAASRVRDAAVLALEQLLPTERPPATYCLGQVRDALLLLVSAAPGEPWSPNLLLYGLLRARARGVAATAPTSCPRCCPATRPPASGKGARPGGRTGCEHAPGGQQEEGKDGEGGGKPGFRVSPTQRLMLAAHWELPQLLEEVTAAATAAGRPRGPAAAAAAGSTSSSGSVEEDTGSRGRTGRHQTDGQPTTAVQLPLQSAAGTAAAAERWRSRGGVRTQQPQWGLVPAGKAEGSEGGGGWNWWVVDPACGRLITWPGCAATRQAATAALQRVLLGLGLGPLDMGTPGDTAAASASAGGAGAGEGAAAPPAADGSSTAGPGPGAGGGDRDGFDWAPAASITSAQVQAVLVQLVRCCGLPPAEVEVSGGWEHCSCATQDRGTCM